MTDEPLDIPLERIEQRQPRWLLKKRLDHHLATVKQANGGYFVLEINGMGRFYYICVARATRRPSPNR
jgi:hypothetical protein